MWGAICGDVLGSIHEDIPKYPRRTKRVPTDDSFLTCAVKEWIMELSSSEFKNLEDDSLRGIVQHKARKALQRWYHYFPIEGGFSKGFTSWAKEDNPENKIAYTNGCLMRQSPIARYCHKKYNEKIALQLTNILVELTHNHYNSFKYARLHTQVIYRLLEGTLTQKDLAIFSGVEIISLAEWKEKNKFIWDAPRSFEIAVTAIHYAGSFEQAIDNCIFVGGDTDTYAAIAGPMAQAIWGIPESISDIVNLALSSTEYDKIRYLYPKKDF